MVNATTVIVLLAAALCVWPTGVVRGRLGARGMPGPPLPAWPGVALVVTGLVGGLAAGIGGAVAALIVGGTVDWLRRRRERSRARAAVAAGLVDALGLLVAELRAGAHPATAAAATSVEAHPGCADVFGAVSAAARLGADVPAVLRDSGVPELGPWLVRIADAWELAARHGIPLAELLEAVRTDLAHRVRFADDVVARLAGPRASAAVLAGLPLAGLALGQAIGADPLAVLAGAALGQVLLVAGTGLAALGVLWSARITSAAVQT